MTFDLKPLAEICEFQRGLTYAKSDEVDAPGQIVLRANNVDLDSNVLDFNELKFISSRVPIPASKLIRPNSLLICTASGSKSHLGKVAYIDRDYGYAFGGFMGQIVPKLGIDGRYLFHALTSPAYKTFIAELSDGANINNLKFDDLGRFQVSVPPLAEQHRIVAILDEAFAGIATAKANAEKNLRNARAVFDASKSKIFGEPKSRWEEKTLAQICVVDWGNTDLTKSSYVDGGQFLAVSAAGCDGRIAHKEHEKHTPVLSAIGAQCGRMFFPDEDFTAIKNTITLTPREGQCTGKFLFRLLDHVELPRRGAAQPFMAKGDIQSFLVRIPSSLGDQIEISERLDELESEVLRLESLYSRKIAALDELKQSLLQRAFSGAL